jgi:gluconate 2-dehydrogenase gamma chain
MTEKTPTRRHFLRQVISVVPAATLTPSIGLLASGCTPDKAASAATDTTGTQSKPYVPTFFTNDEWAFIQAAADELIPRDQYGAGALDAGVPEFIDRQMETPFGHGQLWYMQGPFHPDAIPEMGYQLGLAPRDIYRHGIQACDEWCGKTHEKAFAQLDSVDRVHVLEALEAGTIHLDAVPSKLLFNTLLKNVKEGFLSDPMYGGNKQMAGWKMIGFPGARADFADWIDQPGAKYPLGPVSILGEQG